MPLHTVRLPAVDPRYHGASLVSGLVWGLIALGIARVYHLHTPWGGIVMSPFIGLAIGALSLPMHKFGSLMRALFAVVTVYMGTALFGLCAAFGALLLGVPTDAPLPVHLAASTVSFPVLVTIMPVMWFVFPLAIVNHFWLGSYSGRTRELPSGTYLRHVGIEDNNENLG